LYGLGDIFSAKVSGLERSVRRVGLEGRGDHGGYDEQRVVVRSSGYVCYLRGGDRAGSKRAYMGVVLVVNFETVLSVLLVQPCHY